MRLTEAKDGQAAGEGTNERERVGETSAGGKDCGSREFMMRLFKFRSVIGFAGLRHDIP